jgi:ribosome biogenesis GTPase
LHEPGCGVLRAKQAEGVHAISAISANRFKIYGDLFAELSQKRY